MEVVKKKGTSGARKGYKVFSINTTVRNPKRNFDFLEALLKFDGMVFDDKVTFEYFIELIRNGIYKFNVSSETIKNKIKNNEILSNQEIEILIKDNPQACGYSGRAKTQLRSLKDQGFLKFEPQSNGDFKISLSNLGKMIIENKVPGPIIYSKAMIGMHSINPQRNAIFNRSRPFLNTLFVIDLVNKEWGKLGNEAKGILKHEFAFFVLSMKDCDYKKTANEIIKYREQFKYEIDKQYLSEFLKSNGMLDVSYNTVIKDYYDDVFRKFEMTGLITKRGMYSYTYIDFSTYNYGQVESLLNFYKDYKFEEFKTLDDYMDYLENIYIPWQTDEKIRRNVVQTKAKILKIELNSSLTLTQQEDLLNNIMSKNSLLKSIDKYSLEFLINELLILSGNLKEDSKMDQIANPLRLEYVIALIIGKKYGVDGLVSNLIYDENGNPLHYAPSNKCDIIFIHSDGSYIIEPTLLRTRKQIENNETTNIARHMLEQQKDNQMLYRAMMVAPKVHSEISDYFAYKSKTQNVSLIPITIGLLCEWLKSSDDVISLNGNFDYYLDKLLNLQNIEYTDLVNVF